MNIHLKVVGKEGDKVEIEAYNFNCNKKESLEKLVNQMKILRDNLKYLLLTI